MMATPGASAATIPLLPLISSLSLTTYRSIHCVTGTCGGAMAHRNRLRPGRGEFSR